MDDLQEHIGIAFRDGTLLQEALTHSSFANESPHLSPRDNERLEYLGDAVLQLITAEYLYKYRPGANEGELTQTRSAMVNTNTLASLSEELGIGEHLFLGKGIAKGGGRSLRSLLANAFEAVLGAIFLDAGYDAAYHFYLDRFRRLPEPVKDENHKGRLQQLVQERFNLTPVYDSAGARAGNRREYTAVVFAGADALGSGHGHTKQEAEQDAARQAIARLLGTDSTAEAPAREPSRSRRRRRGGSASTEAAAPPEPAAAEQAEAVEAPPAEDAPGLQPPPESDVAEPVAEPWVGGPEPEAERVAEVKPRARRRRTRAKPAAEPASEAPAAAPEPAAETAEIAEPAPRHRRRAPRRKPPAAAEAPAEPAPAEPAAQPAPEPPPSRQFGQPLE